MRFFKEIFHTALTIVFFKPHVLSQKIDLTGLYQHLKYLFIYLFIYLVRPWASLVAQLVKNPSAIWQTWVRSLVSEDPLEKGTAIQDSILAWRIPWTV